MDHKSSGQGPKERSLYTSYPQSVSDGQSPRVHSQEHEKAMVDFGMIMNLFQHEATIDDDSRELCDKMLAATYEHPKDTLFRDDTFIPVLRRIQTQNEARARRDITPCLVPSAELLYINNNAKLEHLRDELNELWDKCNSIYGPQVKPDFAVGLASSAFTAEEILHLKKNHTGDSPSYVTANIYFPFLICVIKCGEDAVSEAERQAMQSSSIAVKAVVELYRKVSRAHELDRKILAFSICHDHQTVHIHGYYACTTGAKTRYFRHVLNYFNFAHFSRNRWIAYDFTRSVYDQFVPEHVERIRSVLAELQERPAESFTSVVSTHGDAQELGSREVPSSAVSFLGAGSFEKPSLLLQQENGRLHDQISMLLRQRQEQLCQQQEQQRQQQEQMEQLRKESKEQLEQQRKASKERLEKLERQLDRLMNMISRYQPKGSQVGE